MPLPPSDPGPFLSLMGWLDDAGQIAPNLIKGRYRAAGRKTLDLLGDIPDALLPYDVIGHVGDEDEYIRPSELAGIDPMSSPALAKITDMVGGAVLNPLSYSNAAALGRPLAAAGRLAKKGAAKGFEMLPDALSKPLSEIGTTARRSLNWLDVDPKRAAQIDQAKAAGVKSDATRQAEIERTLAWLPADERVGIYEMQSRLDRKGLTDRDQWAVTQSDDEVLARFPASSHDRMRQGKEDFRRINSLMADDDNLGLHQNPNYTPHQYSGEYYEDIDSPSWMPTTGMKPGPFKGKKLDTPEDSLEFMRGHADVDMETDILKVASRRSNEQARATEKAHLAAQMLPEKAAELRAKLGGRADDVDRASNIEQQIYAIEHPPVVHGAPPAPPLPLSPGAEAKLTSLRSELDLQKQYDSFNSGFNLSNADHVSAIRSMIKEIGQKPGGADTAYRLEGVFNGIQERTGVLSLLALGNRYFKAAATYGFIIPRMAFNTGNRFSNVWQQVSAGENRLQRGGKSLLTAPNDLWGSVDDGIMKLTNKSRWAGGELTNGLDVIEQAIKSAKGDLKAVDSFIAANGGTNAKMLQEAMEDGVLNGFVSTEQLMRLMAQTPWKKAYNNLVDMPAAIARGVEQRIRLGTYMDIRKNGGTREAARQTTKDTALDYDVPGVANRTFRDIIPFGAFLSQNVKQQAKFLADKPYVATAAAPLFTSDDGSPKYPWMENTMALPVGLDEQGNPQYMTSFRMPIEGLATIPGGGSDDWYRDVVGSMQPLAKTAVSAIVGKDPFTGREFGTYDKFMGEEAGALGRAWNVVKGSGVIQPLSGPMDQVANWIDERKSAGERAIQGLTGFRFASVDPDMAARQRIEDYLGDNPQVHQYKGYFQEKGQEDPGLSELLKDLSEAKARLKAKREAAAGVL